MEAMEPNPAFDPESYPDVIEVFNALGDGGRVLVWGGDWCPDTRQELPDMAALLEATELRDDQIEVYEVDRDKQGPKVDAYEVTHIPTVVVERDGEELARFVEGETMPAPVYLGDRLREAGLVD